MEKIKKFNESIEDNYPVIKHYFVRQNMEVKGLDRKHGDGKKVVINSTGVITEIVAWEDGDIGYTVKFPIKTTHKSTYGEKWTEPDVEYVVFHNEDKDKIVRVF